MKMRKILTTVLAGGILAGGLAGCSGGNTIKTKGEVKPEINYSSVSEGSYPSFEEGEAAKGYNEYAMKLFAIVAAAEDKNTNVMVSPASVMFALDLADSGACKNTLAEINKAIGGADLTPEQQQAFASDWMKSINSSEGVDFSVANAIWSNRELMGDNMSDEYKNYVKKLFDAEVRSMKFDGGAIKDINGWVNDKTKGMIDKILDELDPATAAVLVNAIAFDGKWAVPYEDYQISNDKFKGISGESDATFLEEKSDLYYESDKAIGFSKLYEGGEYMFVAILPKDEAVDANKFMSEFTGEDLNMFMNSASSGYEVYSKIPKFKNDYTTSLVPALRNLGINDAFDPEKADFTGIANLENNLYISNVLHKTFIEVDENGTKASAVTAIEVECAGIMPEEKEIRYVYCDRPFAYMIVDRNDMTPVFVGTVNNI